MYRFKLDSFGKGENDILTYDERVYGQKSFSNKLCVICVDMYDIVWTLSFMTVVTVGFLSHIRSSCDP